MSCWHPHASCPANTTKGLVDVPARETTWNPSSFHLLDGLEHEPLQEIIRAATRAATAASRTPATLKPMKFCAITESAPAARAEQGFARQPQAKPEAQSMGQVG